MKTTLINRTELKRIVHQSNRRFGKGFYEIFEKISKQMLKEIAEDSKTKTIHNIQPTLF